MLKLLLSAVNNVNLLTKEKSIGIIRSVLPIYEKKDTSLGFKFKQIHDACEKAVNNQLKRYKLTFAQISVLSFLDDDCCRKPVTIRDIEKHFQLQHPTIIGIVERLEDKGFVTTEPATDDKRCRLVKIAEQAGQIQKVMEEHRCFMNSVLVRNMNPEDRDELNRLLDRVLENLTEADIDNKRI